MNTQTVSNQPLLAAALTVAVSVSAFSCGNGNMVEDKGAVTMSTKLVEPTITTIDGNPTCGDLNPDWIEYRLDESEIQNGTYETPDGFATIEITNYDGQYFDWSSSKDLDAVFVKGGPGGLLYSYDPETDLGVGLTAVRDDKNYGVSHVSFCYDVEFARIAIEGTGVNAAGDPHTFTVNVEQKIGFDGAWEPAADGTVVDVNLIPSNGAVVEVSSDACKDPGTVDGLCDVTFSSDTAGIITGHAVTDVIIGNASLHVETDGQGENSGDAVKRYVDATIEIAPDGTNEVGKPHTFTVTAMVDDGNGEPKPAPDGTLVTVTLNEQYGAVSQVLDDSCSANGTSGGQCAVMFASPTAGTVQGLATMTVDVAGFTLTRTTDGAGGNSGPATKKYVDAYITIAPDATNDVRDNHTFVVTAKVKTSTGAVANVPDGTQIDISLAATNGAAAENVENNCASAGTINGICSISFDSATGGLITGHAKMTVNVEGVPLVRETDGNRPNSGDAVKRYVDAAVTIAPSATNGIGEMHTFTVTAKQDDGNGGGLQPVPDGTEVSIRLTAAGGAVAKDVTNTCSGTTNGACKVSFTSDTPGTITGHATLLVTLGGIEIVRQTDGMYNNSGDAMKTFRAGTLGWKKVNADDQSPLAGATFEVCRTHEYVSSSSTFEPLSTPECQSVADVVGTPGPAGDQDGDGGEFALTGLPLGRYTVQETEAPTDFILDPVTRTADLSLANASAMIAEAFQNTQEKPNGCTPGFWKNHTELWDKPNDDIARAAGFNVRTKFNDFFGLTSDQSGFEDKMNMESAIGMGGGGGAKLARHGVAALLNLASGYPYMYTNDATALKQAIADAYINDNFEPLATQLDQANNAGCQVQ